jgi:hypothetical protein
VTRNRGRSKWELELSRVQSKLENATADLRTAEDECGRYRAKVDSLEQELKACLIRVILFIFVCLSACLLVCLSACLPGLMMEPPLSPAAAAGCSYVCGLGARNVGA